MLSRRLSLIAVIVGGATLLAVSAFDGALRTKTPGGGGPRPVADTGSWPQTFRFGKPATPAQVAAIDIDVRPDGHGLPAGKGMASTGKVIYAIKCAACHGLTGSEGPLNRLVSTPADSSRYNTIGNYWPYATTLYDYIRRAMPYNMPGSLTNEEVYHLTAWLLYRNRIIDSTTVLNAATLVKIKMPAQPKFIRDDRHGGPEIR